MPNDAKNQSCIFTQLGTANDWGEIYSCEDGTLFKKRDGKCWFYGDSRVGLLGLSERDLGTAKSLMPCGVEPWAFDRRGATTLLFAKDGTLWSLGERIGYDTTTLLEVENAADHIFGEYWPRIFGAWAFKRYGVDKLPRKIWAIPSETLISLSHSNSIPVGTTNSRP